MVSEIIHILRTVTKPKESYKKSMVQKLGIPIMQNLIHAVIWIRIAK